MKKSYDFSKSIPNPYVRSPKRSITIRLDEKTLEYFKSLAAETGLPYQSLMNLYLRDCADHHRRLGLTWAA